MKTKERVPIHTIPKLGFFAKFKPMLIATPIVPKRVKDVVHLEKTLLSTEYGTIDKFLAKTQNNVTIGNISYRNCRLISLFVNANYRHQGVGTKLFQAAKADLFMQGCQEISWQAYPQSVGFYLTQGAKSTSGSSDEGSMEDLPLVPMKITLS